MAVIQMGSKFSPEVVKEVFNNVKGHSSIAKLCAQTPIAFAGNDVFVFSLDSEVNIVAESGQKTDGGAKAEPVRISPIKVEYGSRVTEEFLYAAEEKQLDILSSFIDGYAKKIARGVDIMAMHGINPRTGSASTNIGTNSFDTNTNVNSVTATSSASPLDLLSDAVATLDGDVTGYALGKSFATSLSTVTIGQTAPFSSFLLGGNPGLLNGTAADVNSTVGVGSKAEAYVGDFANALKWGYAKEIPIEIIPYGDPDGAGDLKRLNQVFIRAEAWIGWGILDPKAFAIVKPAA